MKRAFQFIVSMMFLNTAVFGQNVIEGIIKSDKGEAVVGAVVVIKGTETGIITDTSGQFTLSTSAVPPLILVIKSFGFQEQEIEYTGQQSSLNVMLVEDELITDVVISARRRDETLQDVPIPIAVIGGAKVEETGAFNVNRIKELVPSVQLYSSNPRNTGLNIRGLGSPFGLTNDGLDPGVGYYVDGVYYARPAATTLDFIDVERIEVLRGPQGTLFGKNTSNGAFNVVSKAPGFKPSGIFETSFGNFGYVQAKVSVTGPLSNKLAARVSFSGTQRDGVIYNIRTEQYVNDINNLGFRAQLLYNASEKVKITFITDATRQRPNGYAQVAAGVVTTKRSAYRQFNAISTDLNYQLPTTNAFDRRIDHNTVTRSGNDLGGTSLNVDAKIGPGTLTSTTAWRYWNWDPSTDRDFTGLNALALSQNPSKHQQVSQEIRYAGDFSKRLSGVIGLFAIAQSIKTTGTEQAGEDQWRFSRSNSTQTGMTSELLDGYGTHTKSILSTFSGAVFGQLDWAITNRLHVLPGLRYNYDYKDATYDRTVSGGMETSDPDLIALKKSVYSAQSFKANATNTNLSGNLTLSYKVKNTINTFATYSNAYKPVGVNIAGLPADASGNADLSVAVIKPEYTNHFELGLKTSPTKNSSLNLAVFDTEVKDYQANVQSPQLGVNRGYLANAERVQVYGVELDGSTRIGNYLSFNAAISYTEGTYKKFTNAPLPLEETGSSVSFKDVSGGQLPGISKWAGTIGAEIALPGKLFTNEGKYFFTIDNFNRSKFSSSPSPSVYLNIEGYSLFNARLGFRATKGLTVFVWSRNVFNKNYYEQLLPASGNAGLYAGVLGDQRTFGTTLRYSF